MWPFCPGPVKVQAKLGCQCGGSSETQRDNGSAVEGWERGYNKTPYEDKSGPHAMKNVSLSLTSVANEA